MNPIELRDPTFLRVHPGLKNIPEWSQDDPQYHALIESIRMDGIQTPFLITADGRIMDGRHRWRAARTLQLREVPCIVREEADLVAIIRDTLAMRRHYTKSALAFIFLPPFQGATRNGKMRRKANEYGFPNHSEVQSVNLAVKGKTQEDISADFGLSVDIFHRAAEVAEKFEQFPPYRDEFLPKLFDGSFSLWNILSAIGGREATAGKPKVGWESEQLELFGKSFSTLQRAGAFWKKFDDDKRARVVTEFRAAAIKMPGDLRRSLAAVLTELESIEATPLPQP